MWPAGVLKNYNRESFNMNLTIKSTNGAIFENNCHHNYITHQYYYLKLNIKLLHLGYKVWLWYMQQILSKSKRFENPQVKGKFLYTLMHVLIVLTNDWITSKGCLFFEQIFGDCISIELIQLLFVMAIL